MISLGCLLICFNFIFLLVIFLLCPLNLFCTDENLNAYFIFCWHILLHHSMFGEDFQITLIKAEQSSAFHGASCTHVWRVL